MLANPLKSSLFSVKMMRIDTVAGLLTTALSRTYPPLIPPHIQEMFHNPNGKSANYDICFQTCMQALKTCMALLSNCHSIPFL